MSSKKRSRSKEVSKAIPPPKLRMDGKPQTPKITDPSLPAGRRREIDNVMKKARAAPDQYWDKKLLEVEAKDPNRWRHSGYKSLYMDGSSSPSPSRRSRSRSIGSRRSPRSPIHRSSLGRKSPVSGRRTPVGRRTPPSRRSRSPIGRRSPRSPPPRRSPPSRRSSNSRRSPSAYSRSPAGRRSPPSPRSRPARPRSPPPRKSNSVRRSASASSISSCSDDSCSVCSPKHHRNARSRSRSFSVPRSRAKVVVKKPPQSPAPKSRNWPRPPSPSPSPPPRRMPRPMTPPPVRKMHKLPPSDRPTDPRRQPPPPRPRGRTGEIIDVSGVKPPPKLMKKPKDKVPEPVLLTRIKKERTKKRPGSPGADSSGSDDSSESTATPIVATTRLTLSERFGKIAQWSADRERREMENMRITKDDTGTKVMIDEDDLLCGSPPHRYSISPVPAGHYPDELMSAGPSSRMAAWDDVRVRYQYYKDLGYLRDLSLEDYVKWEEWWYKYQDWLANERHYEHWLSTQRRRRKRVPVSKRLN